MVRETCPGVYTNYKDIEIARLLRDFVSRHCGLLGIVYYGCQPVEF